MNTFSHFFSNTEIFFYLVAVFLILILGVMVLIGITVFVRHDKRLFNLENSIAESKRSKIVRRLRGVLD